MKIGDKGMLLAFSLGQCYKPNVSLGQSSMLKPSPGPRCDYLEAVPENGGRRMASASHQESPSPLLNCGDAAPSVPRAAK